MGRRIQRSSLLRPGMALLVALLASGVGSAADPVTQILDAGGDGVNPLSSPIGAAADTDGNAYVTGFFSDNVFRVTPGGSITEIIDASGDGVNSLDVPSNLSVDAEGNTHVIGGSSDNAFRVTPAGAITQIVDASGDGTHPLANPTDVAVGAEGRIYVTGAESDNVFEIRLAPEPSAGALGLAALGVLALVAGRRRGVRPARPAPDRAAAAGTGVARHEPAA